MRRRTFIQNTSAAALAAGIPGILAFTPEAEWRVYASPDLLQILGDERKVAEIGHAYRRRHPRYDTPESLAVAIKASASHPISEQVRVDFGEGNTVLIDGWVLSLTEARQCALYSYLYS